MTEGAHVSSKPSYRQLQASRQTLFTFVTIFVFKTSAKTPGFPELTFSANTSCYCTTSHPASMLPDTSHHLLSFIPADLPPAIPRHLADCEFYYNTVDLNDVEDPSVLLEGSL